LRSNPLRALPVVLPAALIPIAVKSFEHTHKVLVGSCASTPKLDRVPNAPGYPHLGLCGHGIDPNDSAASETAYKKGTV
jgi:hypothetical protein